MTTDDELEGLPASVIARDAFEDGRRAATGGDRRAFRAAADATGGGLKHYFAALTPEEEADLRGLVAMAGNNDAVVGIDRLARLFATLDAARSGPGGRVGDMPTAKRHEPDDRPMVGWVPHADYELLQEWVRAELADLQASFDLRWKADMRAIRRWQEAGPGRDLTWPDHADLVVWLLERDDDLRLVARGVLPEVMEAELGSVIDAPGADAIAILRAKADRWHALRRLLGEEYRP